MSKNTQIVAGIIAGVIIIAGSATFYGLSQKKPNTKESKTENKSITLYDGAYRGSSSKGGCNFEFQVQVKDGMVGGSGAGTGEGITCNVDLSGEIDAEGNAKGRASGIYTAVMQGVQINWNLLGNFNWTIKNLAGDNLTIDLKGTSNTCPPKIPCTNDPDDISALLKN